MQNSFKLTSLIIGVIFSTTTVPAFAQFQPRDRIPASGYSRAVGSSGNISQSQTVLVKTKSKLRARKSKKIIHHINLLFERPISIKLPYERYRAAGGGGSR